MWLVSCALRSGVVDIDLDATGLSVQERQIGFVFQSYALFNHMTVAENIGFGIRIRKLMSPKDKDIRCG